MMREDLDASELAEGGSWAGTSQVGDCSAELDVLAFIERTFEPKGGGVGPRCSFCGTEDGPFLEVEGGLPLLMCERCRAARDGTAGPAPPLLARRDPGEPWYQWGCALCEARAIWPAELEGHTAEVHPGWTARFEIVRPYPRQVLRVVYRRAAGQGSGEG